MSLPSPLLLQEHKPLRLGLTLWPYEGAISEGSQTAEVWSVAVYCNAMCVGVGVGWLARPGCPRDESPHTDPDDTDLAGLRVRGDHRREDRKREEKQKNALWPGGWPLRRIGFKRIAGMHLHSSNADKRLF